MLPRFISGDPQQNNNCCQGDQDFPATPFGEVLPSLHTVSLITCHQNVVRGHHSAEHIVLPLSNVPYHPDIQLPWVICILIVHEIWL